MITELPNDRTPRNSLIGSTESNVVLILSPPFACPNERAKAGTDGHGRAVAEPLQPPSSGAEGQFSGRREMPAT
jgi:hypothetical protein